MTSRLFQTSSSEQEDHTQAHSQSLVGFIVFHFPFPPKVKELRLHYELTGICKGDSIRDDRQWGLRLSKMWAAIFEGAESGGVSAFVYLCVKALVPGLLWSLTSPGVLQKAIAMQKKKKMCQITP